MGMCWTIAKLEAMTSWKSLQVISQPPWQDLWMSRLWRTLLDLHKGITKLSWWELAKKAKTSNYSLISILEWIFLQFFFFNKASCCWILYPIFLCCLCCLLQVVVLILLAQICCFKPEEESPETPSHRSPKVKPELSSGNKSSIIL